MKKIAYGKSIALSLSIAFASTLTDYSLSANDGPVLEHTGFEDVYATSFFDQSYFVPVTVVGLMLATGAGAAFTTMTSGAGAPAAYTGVGAVAAWVGGNIPGAYMVGLSTVGGYFGGNAILGAAILNGASAAVMSATGSSIVGAAITGTMYLVDGFNYVKDKETGELVFLTTLKLVPEAGSEATRDAVARIMELEVQVMELASLLAEKENALAFHKANESVEITDGSVSSHDTQALSLEIKDLRLDQENLVSQLESLKTSQVEALERFLDAGGHRQGDVLALSLIAWNEHRYDLFRRAIEQLNPEDVKDRSYFFYLKALAALADQDATQADRYLSKAMLDGPYALEPVILRSILLAEKFDENEHRLEELVFFAENHFDYSEYGTDLKLSSLYFRVGSLYFERGRYARARAYYVKANDELGMMQRSDLMERVGLGDQQYSNVIQVHIASADYMLGDIEEAEALMANITEGLEEEEKTLLMGLYEGSYHE